MGERSGEGLPGTIPNPVVKLTSAEGTAVVTPWERTSLPTLPSSCFHPLTTPHHTNIHALRLFPCEQCHLRINTGVHSKDACLFLMRFFTG